MKVHVRYFAALRERIGHGEDEFELPGGVTTVGALRIWLVARGEPWSGALTETRRLRTALDQEMVGDGAELSAGAEVAFFPPVTGG
jgi:molybdopterin synthase sulfur carrier subunit